jgi:hypothetical protein
MKYDRKAATYSDGRYLYISHTRLQRCGVGDASIRHCFKQPDLVVRHFGGFCAETRLYRRDRVRREFGDVFG